MQFSTLTLLAFASGLASAVDVGASGVIATKDGGLGGVITVTNATLLTITKYTLKAATAPALYWRGSVTSDISKGFRINNERVDMPATTDTITIPLDAGHMASEFTYVGLWCEQLNANFGQALLVDPSGSSGSSTSAAAGTGSTAAPSSTGTAAATSSSKAAAAPTMGAANVAMVAAANVLGVAAFLV